ncbi:MAG: ABC transporter ATP-binding protein [Candidatus Shapirobacteria bacterium]|jgi:ABC-type multidrug transport system fused ATPase/permease subunit
MVLKDTKNSLDNIFRTSKWVLSLIFQVRPKLLITTLIFEIFISVLPFARNRLFSNVIDQSITSIKLNNNTWLLPLILFIGVSLIVSLVFYLQNYFSQILNEYIFNDLRIIYVNKISSLDFQHFENRDTANLISKTNDEYRWRTQQVIRDINNLLSNAISLITVGIIIIPHYWYLGVLLVISQIPNVRLQYQLVKKDWEFFNSQSESMRQGWDLEWQLTNKNYLAEIKLNHSKNFLFNKVSTIWRSFNEGTINIRRRAVGRQFLNVFLSGSAIAICLFVLVNDVRQGLLTIGLFTFYFGSIQQVNDIFTGFVNSFISISQQDLYIANFKKIMELTNPISSGNFIPEKFSPPFIEFKNVSFKYPNTDNYIFKNFNLTINPGEEIAIVGANGAGKTTLIKLLLRYYDPETGEILINGLDIKDYRLADWYKYLSFLAQEFNIYQNLSLKENILISRPQIISDKRIISSLKKADAYSYTKKYKNGLDTMMSQRYGGEEPSWGQWQKIVIARVFYRRAPIMILDEPTSSIDAISEAKIFNNIYQKNNHKTLIIVSHRFSTVRNAQRIIVLDKGQIIEQGTHQELLKLKGLYAKSFNLQAKGYQEV